MHALIKLLWNFCFVHNLLCFWKISSICGNDEFNFWATRMLSNWLERLSRLVHLMVFWIIYFWPNFLTLIRR